MYNKDVPTHLKAAADESHRLQELVNIGKQAEELKSLIEKRDARGMLEFLIFLDLSAREVLPLACQAYTELQAAVGSDLKIPDLAADGITYCGLPKEVVVPPLYHLVKAQAFIEAENGSWRLTKGGDFVIGAEKVSMKPVMPVQATNECSPAPAASYVTQLPEQRILMEDSEGSVWAVSPAAHVTADMHFNDPQNLPPVPCAVLIKVPADTQIVYEDQVQTTQVDQILPAFRTKLISDRSQAMEYQLSDGGVVKGRFHWTYP